MKYYFIKLLWFIISFVSGGVVWKLSGNLLFGVGVFLVLFMSGFWEKFKNWSNEGKNGKALAALGSIATILAVFCAVWLGIWQNQINDKLLKLEESSHEPVLKVTVQDIRIIPPYTENKYWNLQTKYSLTNAGAVPLQILGYLAGEEVYPLGTTTRNWEDKLFKEYRPNSESGELEILPVGATKPYTFGSDYMFEPSLINVYKMRIYFKEYPNGRQQCLHIEYYAGKESGVYGVYQTEYSCDAKK